MHDSFLPTDLLSVHRILETFDWSQTSLGKQKTWHPLLKSTLSLILNSSVPMILYWGKDHTVFYNESYIPFIHKKHPALLGRPLIQFWPEQEKHFRRILSTLQPKQAFQYRSRQQVSDPNSDFSLKEIETHFSPILDDEDQMIGILGIITNISEQKEPHTEALEQLIGGIAHDFNTLLGGIIGNLELMNIRIQQEKTDKLPLYIKSAFEASQQATSITNQLLSFSRRQTLVPHITNPNHTIQALTDTFQKILGKTPDKDIHLTLELTQDVWPIFCDPEQFKLALINIFTNACEAIHSLTGSISISSRNMNFCQSQASQQNIKADNYVVITIQDNGTGIKPILLDRIVEPFFTTKPLGKRAGLGLSMAYGFVRQSKGYLKIQSEYMKKTTVRLFLPRYHRPLVAENFFPKENHTLSYKTLILSQDHHLRMLLSENLEDLGYAATLVQTGSEAITLLNNVLPFDFIILDTRILENSNDRNLTEKIHQYYPDLPILFITGYENPAMNSSSHNRLFNEKNFIIRAPLTHTLLADQVNNIKRVRENKAIL